MIGGENRSSNSTVQYSRTPRFSIQTRFDPEIPPPGVDGQKFQCQVWNAAFVPELERRAVAAAIDVDGDHEVRRQQGATVAALEENAEVGGDADIGLVPITLAHDRAEIAGGAVVLGALHGLAVAERVPVVVTVDRRDRSVQGFGVQGGEARRR